MAAYSRQRFIAWLDSKVSRLHSLKRLWYCANLLLFVFFYFWGLWVNFRLSPVEENHYYWYQKSCKQYSSRHVECVDVATCAVCYQSWRKEATISQEKEFLPWYPTIFQEPWFKKQNCLTEKYSFPGFDLVSLSRQFSLESLKVVGLTLVSYAKHEWPSLASIFSRDLGVLGGPATVPNDPTRPLSVIVVIHLVAFWATLAK